MDAVFVWYQDMGKSISWLGLHLNMMGLLKSPQRRISCQNLCFLPWRLKVMVENGWIPVGHRWELPVLHYHEIMVMYPYPFLMAIAQLLSWIIFIHCCICILTGSPR